jgi:hypothetical protein
VPSPHDEAVPEDQTNSAAISLLGRLIPLFGRKNSLLGSVGNSASHPNRINNLQGRVGPEKGLNRRFSQHFPLEQGNPVVVFGP